MVGEISMAQKRKQILFSNAKQMRLKLPEFVVFAEKFAPIPAAFIGKEGEQWIRDK